MRRSRFQVRRSKSRRAVSLLEVLFAILVTTIGLFGALALLPVASSQARKGRINDAMNSAATRCIHEFDARGMRRAVTWIGWNQSWDPRTPPARPADSFQLVTTIPFPYATSFCIDPRFIAANSAAASANQASLFPYTPRVTVNDPRMFRITLNSGMGSAPVMGKLQADGLFFIDDDLTYDRPENDRTLQPTQTYVDLPGAAGTRARRETDGHMSWMATLVPKVDRYSTSFNETYVLSIVMFYDRPAGLEMDSLHERTLTVPAPATLGMPGSGIMGGEVLLRSKVATTQQEADLELKIRANDWIMLSGILPHTLSGNVPVFKWYRVSDTEAEVTFNGTNYERYVTLIGPDWEVPVDQTEAVVVEGVVGVYEKTIRLEP